MSNLKFKRSKKIGLPPGTLLYVGNEEEQKVNLTIIDFNVKSIETKDFLKITDIDQDLTKIDKNKVRWINIEGLKNVNFIKKIGKQFELHPLLLEDIVSTEQRPKFENYGNYLALFLNSLFWKKTKLSIQRYQTTLILGSNYVISFEEREKGVFKPIRERLETSKGKIRGMNADYLFYGLLDVIIDYYFLMIEGISEILEELEEELEFKPMSETSIKILNSKREIISSRKFIRPLREVIGGMIREEIDLIEENTKMYLKDVFDHIHQVIESFDGFKEILTGLNDTYQSITTNKINQIINILTIISTIFIPLSFLTGLYGMNFIFMPELQNPIGYPILLFAMGTIAIVLLIFFKKKRWI